MSESLVRASDGWWTNSALPTPEEWSAFGSVLGGIAGVLTAIAAVIALTYAANQLKQLRISNDALSVSNRETTESNLALTRPYVVVDFEFWAAEGKSGDNEPVLDLVVTNGGATHAVDVRIWITPELNATRSGVPATGHDERMAELRSIFGGKEAIASIAPSTRLVFTLDILRKALADSDVPKIYTVRTEYTDISRQHKFSDEVVIDWGARKQGTARSDPIWRITRDIQTLAEVAQGK